MKCGTVYYLNRDYDQETESIECEMSQVYMFSQLSQNQRIKFLKGRDIEEVFDGQFSNLIKIRRKIGELNR